MKNTLTDLHNMLFAELERLGDEDLQGEDLAQEIKRATAISKLGITIVQNASVQVQALKYRDDTGTTVPDRLLPENPTLQIAAREVRSER